MSQSTSVTPLLLPIVLVIVFAALRRFAPAPAAQDGPREPFTPEEIASFGRWELAALPLTFALMTTAGYVWFWALRGLSHLLIASRGDAVHVLGAEPAYWGVIAIFLGIVSAAAPLDLIYRRLLGDRYARFTRYGEQRQEWDGRRVMRGISRFVAVAAVVWTVCGVNGVTRITAEGIVVGHAFSFRATFHPYSSVRGLLHEEWATAPNGNRIRRPHYVVRFEDGTEWRTDFGIRGAATVEDRAAIAYIASRTGIALAGSWDEARP